MTKRFICSKITPSLPRGKKYEKGREKKENLKKRKHKIEREKIKLNE
jgi:hypothetical protein